MRQHLARIAGWWALLGGGLLLVIIAITSWNVGAFMLGVQGLPGYEDAVRLLISAAALMFFPWCQARRGHVAVDIFVSGLSERSRARLERVWLAMTALAALFLCYWMIIGLLETRADRTATSILGWLEWPFYLPGVVSLALWAAVAAAQAASANATESLHGA